MKLYNFIIHVAFEFDSAACYASTHYCISPFNQKDKYINKLMRMYRLGSRCCPPRCVADKNQIHKQNHKEEVVGLEEAAAAYCVDMST